MMKLTPMQSIAYDIISEILETKHGEVDPCVATLNEVKKSINVELMDALRELCRKDVLSVQIDINKNPIFKIKTPIQ